jgi:hypothetical protein
MGAPILSSVPTTIVGGTTTKLLLGFSDYPATTWTAKLYLAGATVPDPITGTTSGQSFAFTIASTTTETMLGNYVWRILVTFSGETYVADEGTLSVERSIATATPGGFQSWAAQTLPVVEAALSGRLTADQQSYSIAGRSVVKIPVDELMRIRAHLVSVVRQESTPGQFVQDVDVTFGPRGF